jgi:NAD kinase
VLVGDGQEENPLDGSEKVNFTVSEEKARFVSFGRSFYTRARMKLMDGTC